MGWGLGASAAGGSAGARLGLNGLALRDLGSGAHAYGMALGFAYECDMKKAAIYGFQGVTGMIGGGSGMRDLGTLDDLARGAKRLWGDEWGMPAPGVHMGKQGKHIPGHNT